MPTPEERNALVAELDSAPEGSTFTNPVHNPYAMEYEKLGFIKVADDRWAWTKYMHDEYAGSWSAFTVVGAYPSWVVTAKLALYDTIMAATGG